MIKKLLVVLTVVCMLTASSSAYLSPAMELIAKRVEMRKCISTGESYHFDNNSVDKLFNSKIKEITVTSLPDESMGCLRISGRAVKSGETVQRTDFSKLSFQPKSGFLGNAVFSISDGTSMGVCNISVLAVSNYAPETGAQSVETLKDIAVFKTFSAADPENDSMTYEIVDFPNHGSITVNHYDGLFIYRPLKGYMGKDSFSYTATDIHGNTSPVQKVQIKVSKPGADIYFDDMNKHWAHNAAVRMAATGLMQGEKKDGKLCFNPDKDMTRGDFLALSLIMTGHEEDIAYITKTVFADDSMIPSNIKSYAQYAYDKGIISGYKNPDGSVNFEASGSITRAEAAVITHKILSLPNDNTAAALYTDASAIPTWASSAISTLSARGIINGAPGGAINPNKVLSRAEGAQMICNSYFYFTENS